MGRHGTIAGRKAAQDSKRAAVFTKYGRLITVAAKAGGDPDYNPALRQAIDKAKGIGMPNDNITRAIKKGTGELGGETYETITYEGYGAGGVAVVVETLTDNRNRTASEVRHYFDKAGGNMGTPGSVTFMFGKEGVIIIEKEDVDEEALMMDALEAGATDFLTDDEDIFEIRTEANDVGAIRDDLEAKGYTIVSSEPAYIPQTYTRLDDPDAMKAMSKMIDMFEENEDVQNIWHNWENEDEYEG